MLTVEEANQGYLVHIRRFSSETQMYYAGIVRRFLATMPDKICLNITIEHIENFILSGNYKASSRNVALFALRSFFNWLEQIYGFENIAKRIKKLKQLPPKQRILSKAEYQKVIESVKPETKAVIQFVAHTGLRASETVSLTPANISNGFITVIGKGGKRRSIPINRTVQSILDTDPHLNFIKSKSRIWLFKLCRRAAKKANIKPFSPHSLRHFFADSLHLAGVPIGVICKLLGHSNPLTTAMVYVHWQDIDVAGTTNCLDS